MKGDFTFSHADIVREEINISSPHIQLVLGEIAQISISFLINLGKIKYLTTSLVLSEYLHGLSVVR